MIASGQSIAVRNTAENLIWCVRNKIKTGKKVRSIIHPSTPKGKKALKQIARLIAVHLPIYDVICTSTVGSSFIKNAARHKGAVNILNIDIKDFYPSCKTAHLDRALAEYPISNELAIVIRECMLPEGLPIGFNTSPAISNYLMYPVDRELYESIKMIDSSLTITRYFDDITVSSNKELFQEQRDLIKAVVESVLDRAGFDINTSKSKWLRPGIDAQSITGLSLHTGVPSIPNKSIKQNMRPTLDALAARWITTKDKDFTSWIHIDSQAAGYLSYLKQTNILQYIKMLTYLEKRVTVRQGNDPRALKILESIRHERASCQQSHPSS